MKFRSATDADVDRMVALSDAKRTLYAKFEPEFWGKADGANEAQAEFFRTLVRSDDFLIVVAEDGRRIRGFVIGQLFTPPPVYKANVPVLMIDDYCMESEQTWETLGCELLLQIELLAKKIGVELTVVVSAHKDREKTSMLRSQGFSLASEWYYRKI